MIVEALRVVEESDPLAPFAGGETFAVHASEVRQGATRLQGEFYGSDGYRAVQALEESGFDLAGVKTLANTVWPGIFSRNYIQDPHRGVPFLTSSEMLVANPEPKYISSVFTPDLESITVHKGTILISRSGTVGKVAVVNDQIDGWAVTEDALRVNPSKPVDLGVLTAFFFSSAGQFLLTRNKSGSVVEHIYAADVEGLPIPRLPLRLKEKLTALILEAGELRVEANGLLREADIGVHNILGEKILAPRIEAILPCTFIVGAQTLDTHIGKRSQWRLDASFYESSSRILSEKIQSLRTSISIDDIAIEVIRIGKTFIPGVHKVEREYGIPYLTGKELFKIRMNHEIFIGSSNHTFLSRIAVEKGFVLITSGGTIGRVMYVRGNFEGSAVSEDVLRIVPNGNIHPGYIYSFLASSFGQSLIQRYSYGSVIPRIHRTHIEDISIPIPDDNGKEIGQKVDAAFDKRAEALAQENRAIALFEEALRRGRERTETDWGREYDA